MTAPTPARSAPPTLGRVDLHRFLTLGAAVGAVGWGGTTLLTARPSLVSDPALAAVTFWAVLVAVMVGVGVFATPDAVRFSRPMLVWGPGNAAATLVTLGVLFGPFPAFALPAGWALAGAVGYGTTARVTTDAQRRVYLAAAFAETLTFGAVLAGLPPVGVFVLLGVCHAVPLGVVVSTDDPRGPGLVLLTWTLAFLLVRYPWLVG